MTPIVAGGLMYISTPAQRVIALDPDTGREIWVQDLGSTMTAVVPVPLTLSRRSAPPWSLAI